MTSESAKEKIRALLEKRGFVVQSMKEGLFIIDTGASKVGVELFGERPVVGVFINNKLEEEGHGIEAVFSLRSQVLAVWDREINRGASEQKEPPAPKPEPNMPIIVVHQNNKREIMEPKETLPAIVNPEGFLSPVTSIEDALAAFGLFEKAKTQLLNEKDVMWIGANGRPTKKGEGHPHIRRSGWRKMARFFGISCRIASSEKITSVDSEGSLYIWKYRAIAQKGASSFEAEGVCSSRDPFFSKRSGTRIDPDEGDIMLKAQTVAFNRAISDLLGSGEVSADEIKPEEAKS